MFAVADRLRIRDDLIAHARNDDQIVGAALVGSAARGEEDAWSDIDLVLQLAPDADEPTIVDAWTRWIDDRFDVADTLDVFAGARYRVFLLTTSLQIDLSFWKYGEFRGTGESFHLVFGTANPPSTPSAPDLDALIGMGWLYALHARSAIARGKLWQAVMMLDDLRNQIIALACVRHGLNPWHGRDVDHLPAADLDALLRSRSATVTASALQRSLRMLIERFLAEVADHDGTRSRALTQPLHTLGAP
ncbi:nucleotidyltransferase domain-containing protein [Microbacterium pumilum]|uniref:Polymerase nucleotidyl transferase domain-containing protein n=1 Tax=Microbacterium pumilum TaxID=344165 RepID=A0ABN2T5W3_9MICO